MRLRGEDQASVDCRPLSFIFTYWFRWSSEWWWWLAFVNFLLNCRTNKKLHSLRSCNYFSSSSHISECTSYSNSQNQKSKFPLNVDILVGQYIFFKAQGSFEYHSCFQKCCQLMSKLTNFCKNPQRKNIWALNPSILPDDTHYETVCFEARTSQTVTSWKENSSQPEIVQLVNPSSP